MYRFDNVSCSQCGREFGPGDHGFSHCSNHRAAGLVRFEREAKAVWNHHRNKWTQPEWDRLPIATRLHLIRMANEFATLLLGPALVRPAPVTAQAASIEQNPISPEQSNQSGKGE